jgi:hypothetical protein
MVNNDGVQGLVEYSSIPIKDGTMDLLGPLGESLSTFRRVGNDPYLYPL